MINPVSLLRGFVKGILKENKPSSFARACAFGFLLGIIPKSNLTAQLIFILAFAFKTNIPFFFIFTVLFSSLSFLTDKLTDPLGYFILTFPLLQPVFSWMYNAPIIPWTDFNNTIVCGGVVLGLTLFYPWYMVAKYIAERYLSELAMKLAQTKIIRILRLSWLFEWYFKDL